MTEPAQGIRLLRTEYAVTVPAWLYRLALRHGLEVSRRDLYETDDEE
jgi:hypothetical protein